MKFLVIVKANKDSEAGVMPSTDQLMEMGAYNQQLIEAGIMLAGEGLLASSKGARVRFSGKNNSSVTKGPFPDTTSLVAGYWVWKLSSLDEAITWLKKAPFEEGEVEIRQIASAEDFGENFTPELQEQERKMGEQIASYTN
jgi:hypothetical protein